LSASSSLQFQDQFREDCGYHARQRKAETDVDGLEVRLASRTAALVASKRFLVPLSVSLRDTERRASTNHRLHIRSLGFMLAGTW
jgi:hypothetical protein